MILIIQNGYTNTHIENYFHGECHKIKSYESDIKSIDVDKYEYIIILGGYQSILDLEKYSYLNDLVELIQKCKVKQKPLIGICLGCQLLAYALGCTIKRLAHFKSGYGYEILNYEPIFRYHEDYVIANEKIRILATVESMPYIFQSEKMIGIQCHPDINPEYISEYTNDPSIINFATTHVAQIQENNKKLLDFLLHQIS